MDNLFFNMNDIMRESLKSVGEDFYTQYLRRSIFYYWKDIVGQVNAKYVKPLRIEYKNLFVYVKDASWKANVYAYKSTIIKKINDFTEEGLVEDILFGRPNERPAEDENIVLSPPPKVNLSKEIGKINLTDEELDNIKNVCKNITDDELRFTMLKTSISRMKLEKYRRQNNWHECPNCGILCSPKEKICDSCKRLEEEIFRKKIIKILYESPSATYAEIKNEIEKTMPQLLDECLPEIVESIRTSIIQQIASSLDRSNQMQVNLLVMMYKRIPANQLTEKIISEALYKLRYNLPIKNRMSMIND